VNHLHLPGAQPPYTGAGAQGEGGQDREQILRLPKARRRAPTYEEWTRDELYDKAKDVGIECRSQMESVS
jgi:hypothetical protein